MTRAGGSSKSSRERRRQHLGSLKNDKYVTGTIYNKKSTYSLNAHRNETLAIFFRKLGMQIMYMLAWNLLLVDLWFIVSQRRWDQKYT